MVQLLRLAETLLIFERLRSDFDAPEHLFVIGFMWISTRLRDMRIL
jgi:hypothetical protein